MVIVVDIGGTNTRVAISTDGVNITNEISFKTPKYPDDGLKLIQQTVKKLSETKDHTIAIFGIAGVCSPDRTTVLDAPHLPEWNNKFTTMLAQKYLGVPVYLENDAALEALGEASAGAGRAYNIVAYITIGTGIGGARIVNKTIDQTHFGFEIGQQLISLSPDSDSIHTLEEEISGTALEKRYNTPSKNIKDPKIWGDIARMFADGLYNTIVHWSPECVVLGGSVMKDIPLEIITEQLRARMHIFPELPYLSRGELGDLCGIYGGLSFAQKLLQSS